jgi:NTE family protein
LVREIEDRTLVSTLLHLLSEEEWASLRTMMELRSYVPGEFLVEQGMMEPAFHVISDGIASVVARTPQGQRKEIGRLGYGECAGEMSLLTGEPASADVVAVTAVRAYAITATQVARLGELRTRLIEALSAIVAARLRHANERLLALRAAQVHLICCGPADIGALASLPAAMARSGSGRVLALIAGGDLASGARAEHVQADGVTVKTLDDEEQSNLRQLLRRAAHEFDQIVLLGAEQAFHEIAPDASSLLHITREADQAFTQPVHATSGQFVAVGNHPWTPPSLRDLTARMGHPIVGVLPPNGGTSGRGAVAKLARTLTGRQVGLALGAGAAKGLAHLGVLRAINELGITVDVISGCSIGAAVASGWAAGLSVDELAETTERIASRALRPTLPLRSFLSNKGIKEELKLVAGDRRIEDLDMPLALVATDLFRRSEVTFTSGRLWPRILASMALPGVYPPMAAMGSYLVDGAVLNPVPVTQCRELGAGVVVGVRLTGQSTAPRDELDEKPSRPLAIETIMRTFEIMNNRISEMSHVQADVTIEVRIEGGGIRDFKRGARIADEGYRATMDARDDLSHVMPYIEKGAA